MHKLTILFILLISSGSLTAQALKKYPISTSGCAAYFFCDPGTFTLEKSPDSSEVYTGECKVDGNAYGVICVKFSKPIKNLQDAEDVLIKYLDYLKGTLNIVSAVGYGKGHRLKDREDTRGVIDYWKDKDGINWKINGWTNGNFIGVMYVYTNGEVPETKANIFLNSLLFKSM
jgi:hypothetical protein